MYEPASGRFDGLDPYAGNSWDPQSYNKYLYTHADPVNHSDPTGEMLGLAVGGILGSLTFRTLNELKTVSRGKAIGYSALAMVAGYSTEVLVATLGLNFLPQLWNSRIQALWELPTRPDRPKWSTNWIGNGDQADFQKNLEHIFANEVMSRNESPSQREQGLAGAKQLAEKYVEAVSKEARDGSGGWLQSTGFWFASWGNADEVPPDCITYCYRIESKLASATTSASGQTGWVVKKRVDSRKFGLGGWASMLLAWPFPGASYHSYFTIAYRPNPANPDEEIDFILDPWTNNRPEVYGSDAFLDTWPTPPVGP